MIGQTVGPYRLNRVLGRGGMGTVYAAVHEETGEAAAVKLLAPASAADSHFRERFLSEVEALKMLQHPHIVEMFAYGDHDGQLYYAMELLSGRSLQDELRDRRIFEWREAVAIGIQVCSALKHAHDRGVIHRDIKPANLLRDEHQRVKLSDFGIARLFTATHLTAAGAMVGTADYMSPEQAEGRVATVRSDLYSLACVLYALLARRPPFVCRSVAEAVHRVRFDTPEPVTAFAPDTPRELDQLLQRLLQKDPQQRIATAQALSNRLGEVLELAGSADPPASTTGSGSADDAAQSKPSPDAKPPSAAGDETSSNDPRPGGADDKTPADNAPDDNAPDEEAPDDAPSHATADFGSDIHTQDSGSLRTSDSGAPPSDSGALPTDSGTSRSDSGASSHSAVTVASPSGASPPQRWHVDSIDRPQIGAIEDSRDEDPFRIAKLVGLVVAAAAIVALVVYLAWPASADALYERIRAAAESGEVAPLLERQGEIERFLDRFPGDPRSDEVQGYLEQVQLHRDQRSLELRARFGIRGEELAPAERAYFEAVQVNAYNPAAAAQRFQAIIDVFGDQPDASPRTRHCVELARRQLEQLQSDSTAGQQATLAEIERQLERAAGLYESEPDKARDILRGIIVLYGDKPWAQTQVDSARNRLAPPSSQ